jgi:hypothetical protein
MKRARIAGALLLIAVTACMSSGPRQTKLMKTAHMTVSASELRVEVRSLADRFSGLMEEAGEVVLRSQTEPERRRNALMWLTNGIPAMQQALFQPDPVAALLDAWFLIAQIRGYFESRRPTIPSDVYGLGIKALDEMEADLRIIIENSGPEVSYQRGRELVYGRAAEYPIDHTFASRRASTVFLSTFTAQTGGGALKSIGSITETVEDLVARIDLNAEYIPKLARWQAMIFMIDGGYDTTAKSIESLQYIELVAAEVERLAPLVESLPDLVADERLAVLEALDASLTRTLAFVDQQRTTLMGDDVRAEREAVLATIREERIAVLEAISEERRIILDALREERAATFDDLDTLMDDAFTREVNKMFIRGLILIGLFLVGFATIVFFGVRALKQRKL